MNICFLSPYPPQTGGVPVHTRGLINALERRNRITVITYGRMGRKGTDRTRIVEVPVVPVKFLRGLSFFIGAVIQLFLLSRKKGFDVIHAEYMLPLGAAALFYRKIARNKPPVIVTAHGSDLLSLGKSWLSRIFVRWVGNSSDRVICVSRYLSIEAVDLGIHAGKVHVIHNGIDEKDLPRKSKKGLREELKLPDKKSIITFIGSLSEAKGADIFAILAYHFKGRIPDAGFYLVGGGPDMKSLRKYCSKRGISDSVTFTGPLSHDESLKYMKASDVLVIPSRIEGFGLTALEGMSLGIPVAATKSGALSEILCEASLTDNLPGTVKDILTKKSFRSSMVKENKKKASKFSWGKMANETVKLYRDTKKSA